MKIPSAAIPGISTLWSIALIGCADPQATSVDCGSGARVEHQGRIYCVYTEETIESFACPPGLDVRVETTGAIVCAEVAPANLCDEVGLECPPASVCPESEDFDGHDSNVAEASDGLRSAVVGSFRLHAEESYSRGYHTLFVDDDGAWWPHSNDRCGVSGLQHWWGWRSTRVDLAEDGVGSAVADACVTGTYPLVAIQTARSGEATLACGVGHHPYFAVNCGPLEQEAGLERTLLFDGAQETVLGASASGFLVYASRREPAEASITSLDSRGSVRAQVAAPRVPNAASIVRVHTEWWLLVAVTEPLPAVRVQPITDALELGEAFELPFPHRTAQNLSVHALDSDAGDGVHALVSTTAPDEPARLTYLLIRPDRTFATRVVQREADEQAIAFHELQLGTRGFHVVSTALSASSGVRTTRLLRIDCDGRLREPPLVLARRELLTARAIATRDDTTWLVTSEGTDEPGYENVLHTIRTR